MHHLSNVQNIISSRNCTNFITVMACGLDAIDQDVPAAALNIAAEAGLTL